MNIYDQMRKDWGDGTFPVGSDRPSAAQVEVYIFNAEAELGPTCGDDIAVWCAKVLRAAVGKSA